MGVCHVKFLGIFVVLILLFVHSQAPLNEDIKETTANDPKKASNPVVEEVSIEVIEAKMPVDQVVG